MEIKILEVGKKYLEYIGMPDGIICNITDSGMSIRINLHNPKKDELKQLSEEENIKFKVLKIQGIIFVLFKFGSLQWMDAPYSVFLTNNLSILPFFEDGMGYSATIEVYDTATGKLCILRHISLPTEMSRQLVVYMNEQFQEYSQKPFTRTEMGIQLGLLYKKYSTKDLVKFAPKIYALKKEEN